MFLLEVSITRQNESSGAVKKNVNKLPLLLDEDEDDVEVATLSSTGCMLGDSSNIACSPRSSPLMDCERRIKVLLLMIESRFRNESRLLSSWNSNMDALK